MPDYGIYGVHFYGTARYGRAPATDLSLARFTATPEGYGQVRVEWGKPTGAWDKLRLVRGAYGYPTDETDGRLLTEAAIDVTTAASLGIPLNPGFSLDTTVMPLRFYYYSFFLRQTSDQSWVRAGDVVCLVPGDFGYSSRLYELLPQFLRDGDDYYTIARGPDQGAGVLQTFLAVFGYELDNLRSELDSLLWVDQPLTMAGGLLPLLGKHLGLPYESELGMALVRRQINNIVYLYKVKGTKPGVEGTAYAFSGWAANASPEINALLSNDDASFEYGTGRWYEYSNVVLSRQGPGLLATSGSGSMVMTAPTAAAMEARLPAMPAALPASLPLLLNQKARQVAGPASLPLLLGAASVTFLPSFYGAVLPDIVTIPQGISLPLLLGGGGGRSFTFSAYFQPITTVRNVFIRLIFFDVNNAMVGSVDGTPVSEINTSTPVRAIVTAIAPSTARYAGFALVVQAAGAGEQHLVDALQFEPGSTATTWRPANGLKLVLLADRVNRCENPSFETDTSLWTQIGCTFTRTAAITAVRGSYSGVVTTTASAALAGIQMTNRIPCTPGVPMAFSSYWQAAATVRPVITKVDWYNTGGQRISSSASDPDASLPLLFNPQTVVADAVGSWTRFSFITIPPVGAVNAVFSTFIQPVSGTLPGGEVHYVDAVLIEQASRLGVYFDASSNPGPISDYLWEGTPHLSRSHYYHRRATRESRLRTRLPDFLPAGSTLRILDAQPL